MKNGAKSCKRAIKSTRDTTLEINKKEDLWAGKFF